MEASNEFRRREPMLLAIFAAEGPAAIEFRCGDAAMTEKSYQPSRESGGCRMKLHSELWLLLRRLEPELRWELLGRLCTWAGIAIEAVSAHRPLTAEEVRRLAEPGFIDIGAHTVTHTPLSLVDETNRRAEIRGSRAACEELIGEPIHTFSYPFGEFDDVTAACVRDAGFACACTTQGGRVSRQSELMRLPRFGVGNWTGAELASKLTTRLWPVIPILI